MEYGWIGCVGNRPEVWVLSGRPAGYGASGRRRFLRQSRVHQARRECIPGWSELICRAESKGRMRVKRKGIRHGEGNCENGCFRGISGANRQSTESEADRRNPPVGGGYV